ncbi:MAG: hypothetical protein ACE5GE_09820 [Phycisphaerae bacterium]
MTVRSKVLGATLALGVVSALYTATDLVVRMGRTVGEMLAGPVAGGGPPGDFGTAEAICWALLALACLTGRWSLPGRAWLTALFILVSAGAMRMALTQPAWAVTSAGTASRSALPLVLMGLIAAVLCVFVAALGRSVTAERIRWLAEDPTQNPPHTGPWPGFTPACTALGLSVILLACYHLGVGFEVAPGGTRLVAGLVSGISLVVAVTLLLLLRAQYTVGLADVGAALICLALCCAAVVFVPGTAVSSVERYPMILNAAMIGLAVSVCFWTWMIGVWDQQLDHGQAWTVAGQMIKPASRVTFFAGLFGLVTGSLMTAWPHLADAPGMDHSFGRVTAGVAGHLCLIGAVLWSARRQHRSSLTTLTVLLVLSMLAFIYARTVPLTTAAF